MANYEQAGRLLTLGLVVGLGLTAVACSSGNAEPQRANASAPIATPAHFNALEAVIAGLETGKEAQVTASDVLLPDPVSGADKGQPIVFTDAGIKYYAYTQYNKPNFTETPEALAGSMAITPDYEPNAQLAPAHLVAGTLVDSASQAPVGYSIKPVG